MSFVLKNVSKTKGDTRILRDISFKIPDCGIFIVMGPSGSGKSTLLRLLNRLDEPDSGKITYLDKDIREYDPRKLRREVSFVFQTPSPLPGTVEENIRFGTDIIEKDVDIEEILVRVGLGSEYRDKMADELSVGESQRMMIGRAIALDPAVLLLDEPTSALDPGHVREIERLVKGLVEDDCTLAIFVTHSTEQVRRLGGKGVLINEGRIAGVGDAVVLADRLEEEE
jgi:putative ABC transport system ATP-binding protein